jgi:4'-phosphopantetheinyl transferase
LARLLSPVEAERGAQYRRDADRARFTVAAALLRLVAGAHLGVAPGGVQVSRDCPDCDRPHGRPVLPGRGWACSVSHSGDRVAVVVGRTGPLGVDVEEESTRDEGIADLALTEAERAELVRAGRADGLLTYWTRKEAVLKATGEGLRIGLQKVSVSAPDVSPALVASSYDPSLVTRATLRTLAPGSGYLACLAALDTPGLVVAEMDAASLLADA